MEPQVPRNLKFVYGDLSSDPSDHGEPLAAMEDLGAQLPPALLDGVTRVAFHDFDGFAALVLSLGPVGWRAIEHLSDASGIRASGIEAHSDLGSDPRGLLAAAFMCEYPHVEVESLTPAQARNLVAQLARVTGKAPSTLNEGLFIDSHPD